MEIIDGATPPVDPQSLITNIFLGDGVEVLDVVYEGDPLAVGLFTNGDAAVGIDRGIVLTSGRAASNNCNTAPLGANCNGNQFASSDNASPASDADLESISGGFGALDVAKFTITFIPTSDTLRFKYVFASEEYPEYSCTSFNDVFGFFISGPGITGPYENNGANIALIPNTNIPVTINNIHPPNPPNCNTGEYDQYYNDNQVAAQPVYDGYLDVFTAEAIVTPCETYTIKLAIADAGDQIFDTGVFLEAKSFGTGSLQVETATVSLDGTITEDCATGTISFGLPGPTEEDFPLDYTIIGTAENGVDYDEIPLDLFIPEGDSSLVVDIIAFEDFIAEGLESIGIDIQRDICNRDTFWIYIRDNEIVPPDLGPDSTICNGDSMQLNGELPIPLPVPPSFTNDQDYPVPFGTPVYSNIQVVGVQPVELADGVIQSVCVNIDHNWADDLDLFLLSPGGQFIELSTDNGQDCDDYPGTCFVPGASTAFTDIVPIGYDCMGGESTGFTGGFMIEGVWSDLWDGDYPTNGTWQLLVVDDAQGFDGTLLDWTITFEPLYQIYYEWSPTDGLSCADCPDPIASPSQTTTYTLTASDTYGCSVTDSITINVLDVLPAPNINCTNITNNSITFDWDAVAGAMGYMVSIDGAPFTIPNNGAQSHIVNNLTLSQSVTIEVFAIGTCDGEIGTAVCETPGCDAPSLEIVNQTNLNCPGDSDGLVIVQGVGGAGNYTYWIDTLNTNQTGVFNGLTAGTYQITVIDDWMCPNSIQVTISEPDSIEYQEVVVNDISCFGFDDGSAAVEISGGTGPFTFAWGNGETDSIAVALTPGTNTVDVTDANGCSFSTSVEILEPEELLATATADSVDCFAASTGSVQVDASGGVDPLLFEWSANAGNATTDVVNALPADTYTVVVTDLNGCQVTASATIEEPAGMNTSTSSTLTSCFDSSDGTATVDVSGGEPDYQYDWSNGGTEQTATLLASTTYYVTVTDANGCTLVDSALVESPSEIEITLTGVDADCFGAATGSISSEVTGGTPPYSYQWDNGSADPDLPDATAGEHCLTVFDFNNCEATVCLEIFEPDEIQLSTVPTNAGCNGGSEGEIDLTVEGGTGPFTFEWSNGQTTEDISGLIADTYSVVVTDANGCQDIISETISETDAIAITIDQTLNVQCKDENTGSIEITATGGSGTFTYTWSGPNGYTSASEDPTDLFAGAYTVIVEDTDGCSAQIDIEIDEPSTAVVLAIDPTDEICFGDSNGQVVTSTSGGTPDYSYEWSNGETTFNLSDVPVGIYTVTVSDQNGCTDQGQAEIVQQPELVLSLSQTSAGCAGSSDGTASLTNISQGGTSIPFPDVQIQWSFGGATTPEVTGLTGGETYSVTVTNAIGCTASASITIDDPAAIGAALVSSTDVSCFSGNDGTATVTGEGGTLPYSYQWDANAGNNQTATAADLSNGNYLVTVTDANGCSIVFETEIGQPTALDLGFQNEKVKCFGGADGTSFATANGGTAPYSYIWSNGQTTQQATDLLAGMHDVTVTDANGCTLEMTTEITEPEAPLSATFSVQDVSCFDYQDGSITIVAEGGSEPYRYSLDGVDFNGTPHILALEMGSYNVIVQDINGCTFQLNDIFVDEPEDIQVDLGPDTITYYGAQIQIWPTIIGLPDSQLVTVQYEWFSNNPLNPVLYPDWSKGIFKVESPTSATLVITTENGCKAEDLINIFVVENREVVVPTGFAPGAGGAAPNDLLHVHGQSQLVEKISLFQVFDRWGELLYEVNDFAINDLNVGWDGTFKGKNMPAGVYVWYVEVDFIDGISESYKGQTTLIR